MAYRTAKDDDIKSVFCLSGFGRYCFHMFGSNDYPKRNMRRTAIFTVFSVLLAVTLVVNNLYQCHCHCHCCVTYPVEFLYDHRKRKHDDITKLGPGLPPPAAWEARSRFCSHRNSDKLGVIESAENGLSDAFEAKAGVSDDEIKHENDCSLLKIEARVKKIDEVGHDEDVDEVGYDGDEDLSSAFSLLGLSEEDEEEVDERRIVRKLDKEKEEVPEGTPLFKEDSRHDRAGSRDTTVLHTAAMEPQRLYSISPNGSFKRNIKFWQKGERLGSGFFGTVYEAIADDGFFFAVKEVSLLDEGREGEKRIYQLEQEILLLSQSEHKNIVQYLGTDKDDSKLYIFLELATKGSLAKVYQKYHLRDPQVSAYTRQILNGLNYLHSRNVIHRDIKCANILVDAGGSVKLADFGLAKATRLNDINSCRGTPFWMAPEVVNQNGYGLSADIWSLGCTVLEMLTCQIPYFPLEGVQAMFKIGHGILPNIPDYLSSDAQDFILKCLKVNPNDRPTAAQLLDHPFVKRPESTFLGPASPNIMTQLKSFNQLLSKKNK